MELLVKDILPDLEKATDVKAIIESARVRMKQTTQTYAWDMNQLAWRNMTMTSSFSMPISQLHLAQQAGMLQQQQGLSASGGLLGNWWTR